MQGLEAGYHRHKVLKGIDLVVRAGEFVGLAGPNGSGKTTLLHCLTGYHQPSVGVVKLGAESIARLKRREIAGQVAFVPQKTETVFAFSVLQMVLMGRHPFSGFAACDSAADVALAMDALHRLHIAGLAERPFDELSGGEKQLVLLARAFAQAAPLLVLDEPLTGLDLRHQFELMTAVRRISHETGNAALATFHDLSVASRWCDRLVLLHEGIILADGPPAEVITAKNLELLYGVVAEVHSDYRECIFISVNDSKSPERS